MKGLGEGAHRRALVALLAAGVAGAALGQGASVGGDVERGVEIAGEGEGERPEVRARIGVARLPRGDEVPVASTLLEAAAAPAFTLLPLDPVALDPIVPEDVERLEEEARADELRLEFREAVVHWRALVELLSEHPLAFIEPQRLARARLSLGVAYAEAGEPDLAIVNFQEALAFDAQLETGPEYPPHVRDLFDRAQRAGGAVALAPGVAQLTATREAGSLDGVLWLATGLEGGQPHLVHRLHLRGDERPRAEVRLRLPPDPADAAALAEAEGRRIRALLEERFPAPPPPRPPWYREGWVLGAAGGVLVAGLAAGTLAWALGRDRVELVIEH